MVARLVRWSLLAGAAAAVLFAGAPMATPPARASESLALPLRVDTSLSLLRQFGYAPAYELNVPSFDPWGRACIRSRGTSQHATDHVHVPGSDGWSRFPLVAAVRRDFPSFAGTVNAGGYVSETVEFDGLGRAYTLLDIRLHDGTRRNVLLYSLDGCATWKTLLLPFAHHLPPGSRDDGTATIEHFSGWNTSEEPPLVAVWRRVSPWPGLRATRNKLYVVRTFFAADELRMAAPTLVTTRHIGMTQAAGGASFAATSGSTSYIVWTEVASATANGSPTFVATLDRAGGRLSPPVRVAASHPANDAHATPGICLDSEGYLHVVTGAHQRPFLYTRSVRPSDGSAWTRPRPVLTSGFRTAPADAHGSGRQTYLSLACLPDDRLVVVFRQQRAGVDRIFAGGRYDALCVQTKARDGGWSPARRLVCHKTSPGYAIFYHKLAVDRTGRLFLSLNWCRPERLPSRRALATPVRPPHGPSVGRRGAHVALRRRRGLPRRSAALHALGDGMTAPRHFFQ